MTEAKRILDREARRLLAAGMDRDAIDAATGRNVNALDRRPDERPPRRKRQHVPIGDRDRQRRAEVA